MSFLPYAESEPVELNHTAHDLAFIAIGLMGELRFDWNESNRKKIAEKHHLAPHQVEAVVKDRYGFVGMVKEYREVSAEGQLLYGITHELRYVLINQRDIDKFLKVVFTLRLLNSMQHVRPISAHYLKEKDVRRKLASNRYNGAT